MNNLYEYLVNNFKLNEPIILSNLKIDGMSYDNLRQQMKKLVDDGKVKRYENGVYYLPKPSKFNLEVGLNPETVLEYKYLIEDGKECGYMTGLLVFNQLGLTSQVPMVYEIATNKATNNYRETTVGKSRLIIKKPRTTVTKENYKILQFLDLLKDVDVFSELSGKQLQDQLAKYMKFANIKVSDMEPYFDYYPDKLYKNLVKTKVIFFDILNKKSCKNNT